MQEVTQIIIPMAGKSQRFFDAGYLKPKPLIEVLGKPIIGHILEKFKEFDDVIVIVNEKDSSQYNFANVIKKFHNKARLVEIKPHIFGPSYSIIEAQREVALAKKVIVHYCDVLADWDLNLTLELLESNHGVLLAFTGFHPSSINSTTFAYALEDNHNKVLEIREKASFTFNPEAEFASCGIYAFCSGAELINSIERQILSERKINGEFYISLAQQLIIESKNTIKLQQVEKFFSWGTPEDLEDYIYYSEIISLIQRQGEVFKPVVEDNAIILAAGKSTRLRLTDSQPKQSKGIMGKKLIDFSKMLAKNSDKTFLVATSQAYPTNSWDLLEKNLKIISHPTDSQISTVKLALNLDFIKNKPLTFLSSDNIMVFDDSVALSQSIPDNDVCVWTCSYYPIAKIKPQEYSWVKVSDENLIENFLFKSNPSNLKLWRLVTGNFTFRNADILELLLGNLEREFDTSVREPMLDDLIPIALRLNLRVSSFDVKNYLTLGSLVEDRMFDYWMK
jgi:hypothetical protein